MVLKPTAVTCVDRESQMVRKIIGRCVLYLTFLALPSAMVAGAQGEEDHLRVRNPVKLPARLPAERIAIGSPGDYKPCIPRLPSGELLIVAFHQHSPKPGIAKGTHEGKQCGERCPRQGSPCHPSI